MVISCILRVRLSIQSNWGCEIKYSVGEIKYLEVEIKYLEVEIKLSEDKIKYLVVTSSNWG